MDNNELDLFNNNDNTNENGNEPQPERAEEIAYSQFVDDMPEIEQESTAQDLVQEQVSEPNSNEMPSYAQTVGYESQQEAQSSYNSMQDEPKKSKKAKKEKKQRGFFFKAVRNVVCAVLIGSIAGASFYGAAYAGYIYFPMQNEASEDYITQDEIKSYLAQQVSAGVGVADGMVNATVLDVSDIVSEVISSVVAINGVQRITYNYGMWGIMEAENPCSGSGIILGTNETELLIVTNAHVVEDVEDLEILFCDSTTVPAQVKGMKTESDLAVVAVKLEDIEEATFAQISAAKLSSTEEIEVGEAAIAIGNAAGYGISVTTGIVSAVNRSLQVDNVIYDNLIQTDAAINPGNSGGALFNSRGELMGINSVKLSDTSVEGMGYAISIASVRDIIEELSLKETQEPAETRTERYSEEERGFLGVQGVTVIDSDSQKYGWPIGVLIRSVSEDTPAAKAGLKANDVITRFDNTEITSWEQLYDLMYYYKAGEEVEITYYRLTNGGFEELIATVTLASRPETK